MHVILLLMAPLRFFISGFAYALKVYRQLTTFVHKVFSRNDQGLPVPAVDVFFLYILLWDRSKQYTQTPNLAMGFIYYWAFSIIDVKFTIIDRNSI
jgi:hypothetical protein